MSVNWQNLESEPKTTKQPTTKPGSMTSAINFFAVGECADGYTDWLKATGKTDCEQSVREFCECNGAIPGASAPKVIHG